MARARKRRGKAPAKKPRRVMMALRVTPALHDEIMARVQETGRSITQEMELLLEHALVAERTMGSKAWRLGTMVTLNFARVAEDAYSMEAQDKPKEPLDYPGIYREGLVRVITLLAESEPDLDGLFAEVRQRIEQRRGRPRLPEQALRDIVEPALAGTSVEGET